MAIPPGQIPSPQDPLIGPDGKTMTRTWYRVIAALTGNIGKLATSIIIPPNSFFTSGSLNSGGTLEPQTIPTDTVLGNSAGVDAAAAPQAVDASLSLNGGKLSLAEAPAQTLLGNAGTVATVPEAISIGQGLSLSPTVPPTLSAVPPSLDASFAFAQTISWWRGI